MDGFDDGVRELLLIDGWRTERGIAPVCIPFRIDVFEEVREDGKEDKEGFRLRVLPPLVVVPLVEGRYERTEVMIRVDLMHCRRQTAYQFGQIQYHTKSLCGAMSHAYQPSRCRSGLRVPDTDQSSYVATR